MGRSAICLEVLRQSAPTPFYCTLNCLWHCMVCACVLHQCCTVPAQFFFFNRAVVFMLLKHISSRDLAALSPATQVLSWEWVTMTFSSTHVAPVGSVWNTHPSTEVWDCGAPETVNLRRKKKKPPRLILTSPRLPRGGMCCRQDLSALKSSLSSYLCQQGKRARCNPHPPTPSCSSRTPN